MAIDGSGNVVVTGYFLNASVHNDYYTAIVYREALPPVAIDVITTAVRFRFTGTPGRRYGLERALTGHRTKGCGSRKATLTIVWQLARAAQKGWRRLNDSEFLAKLSNALSSSDEEKKAAA